MWVLIAANAVVFLFQASLTLPELQRFLETYALIPARYFGELATRAPPAGLADSLPFLSNAFLHGGWWHLLLNTWTLWIFGPAVEDRLGAKRFLAFYLFAGIAASLAHALVNADSMVPALGASGAIAGVIGCYVRMFPRASTEGGGIAWWAHIGGFVVGWAVARWIRLPGRSCRQYYADEASELGLPVSTIMPDEVLQLMTLYPQPVLDSGGVEYLPVPRRRAGARG